MLIFTKKHIIPSGFKSYYLKRTYKHKFPSGMSVCIYFDVKSEMIHVYSEQY